MMKKLLVFVLAIAMSFSLAACGGDAEPAGETVSLVDITTDQGISMKIPSDMILQEETRAYLNEETGDNVAFGVTGATDLLISDWTEEDVSASYQSQYPDATVQSFENGVDINGREALIASVTFTTAGGNDVAVVLVILTDGTTNYIVNFTYGSENADSALANNLQTCIDSITIA